MTNVKNVHFVLLLRRTLFFIVPRLTGKNMNVILSLFCYDQTFRCMTGYSTQSCHDSLACQLKQ